ncbi:hypothetical protein [Fulvivirga lutea]|uniref:Uncharacterized protein n=1 Tax=Fulvivirga lutea TaxID=2810512 RepID=A0A974ZZI3_9BACT|nr:hypothetical protein [Fulvivirga lutea]QSE96130.1 hypothetical protein JR347_10935 [Fulvivirga lutea]
MWIVGVMLFLFYGLPNIINFRERQHFSSTHHLEEAQELNLQDTTSYTKINASDFYDRGWLVNTLFGSHYREVWSTQVLLPVLHELDTFQFHKVGGGMQTTSIEVRDSDKRSFTLRTLDKDQAKVLPQWLYPSALRLLLRDQTSALNPFGSEVVAGFSEALGIYHTSPKVAYVPYNIQFHDSINHFLAGKAVVFEEEPGSKWKNKPRFNNPKDILNTEELFELLSSRENNYAFDTLAFLKCRLFDLLISDWDRHGGQWKWVLEHDSITQSIKPFPIDRDMAFCRFDDGLVNKLVVSVTNKFKSFRKGESIFSIAKKTNDLDSVFLKNLPQDYFLTSSQLIKETLSDSLVHSTFTQRYPAEVYELIGEEHTEVLQYRLHLLDSAAILFKKHIDMM